MQTITMLIIILSIVLIVVIIGMIIFFKKGDSKFGPKRIPEIDKKILLNIFDIYKKVQYGWSAFDISTLREYLSPEFYNYYLIQLDKLKGANQKNIIQDIELIEIRKLYFRPEGEDYEKIIVTLKTIGYNYIIDNATNEVIRGDKARKVSGNYKITLRRRKTRNTTIVCPNCGRVTEFNDKGECKFCNAFILDKEYHFIIQQMDRI